MSYARRGPAGVSYQRLVPSSLIPPEDPSSGPAPRSAAVHRTVRDWSVDLTLFVLATATAVLFYMATKNASDQRVSDVLQVVDVLGGAVACLSLWGRRRWPVAVGVLTALLQVVSANAAPASAIGLFSVSAHRRTSVALALAALNLGAGAALAMVRPQAMSFWISMLISVAFVGPVVAWGMYVRARRQLIWTLRERAERAEAEQKLLADQARTAERTRIAREMHDVLGHRISLISLHAGGLQVLPDQLPEQVQETARLLRSTAHQALEELRGVIGVLRDDSVDESVPVPPQPTLGDIPRLIDERRHAGAKVQFTMDVPGGEPSSTVGRDAYRIVQEALTNVAKHASGTATTVHVIGKPGAGLRVEVRNQLPVAVSAAALPGSGSGLLGLRERVTLAGGTLEHGPRPSGVFVVDAWLSWPVV